MDRKPRNDHTPGKSISTKRKIVRAPYPKSKPAHKNKHLHAQPSFSLLERRLEEADTSSVQPCTPCTTRLSFLDNLLRRTIPAPLYSGSLTRDYDYVMGRFAAYGSMSGTSRCLCENRRIRPSTTALIPTNSNYSPGRTTLSTDSQINVPSVPQRIDSIHNQLLSSSRYRNYYNFYENGCHLDVASRMTSNLTCTEFEPATLSHTSRIRNSLALEKIYVEQLNLYDDPTYNSVEVDDILPLEINNKNMGHFKEALGCARHACIGNMTEACTQTSSIDKVTDVEIQDENTNIVQDINIHIEDVSNIGSIRGIIIILTNNDLTQARTSHDNSIINSKDFIKEENEINASLQSEWSWNLEETAMETYNLNEENYEDALETEHPDSNVYVKDLLSREINKELLSNASVAKNSSILDFEDALDMDTSDPKDIKTALLEEIYTALRSNIVVTNSNNKMDEKLELEDRMDTETLDLMVYFNSLLVEKIDTALQESSPEI